MSMMSMKDAHSVIQQILGGPRVLEMPRLERIHNAMRVDGEFTPTVCMPPDAPRVYAELARKSHTDFLRLIIKEFSQAIKVEGYITKSDESARGPWWWWQRNQMDARQAGLTRSVLKYGASYALAYPGDFNGIAGPAVRCFSPRQMTAVYANDWDEWPMYALYTDRLHTVLVDAEGEYRFGVKNPSQQQLLDAALSPSVWSSNLEPIERRPHGMGFVPVVRYTDRWLLDGEMEYGIVEPLLSKQEHIDQIEYEKSVAQYTTAFRQRYVENWVPEDPSQELKSNPGAVWYIAAEDAEGNAVDVKVGEFSETDLTGYLNSGAQARRDLASLAQIPVHNLGIDGVSNISGDALEALNNSRNQEASEISTSLGESHEQLMRLFAYIDDDTLASEDYESEVRWADLNSRTYAQMVDGLSKLVAANIISPDDALDDVPGMTEQRAQRIRARGPIAPAETDPVASLD